MSKAAEATKRMSGFDGTWIVKETCPSQPPFPAATLQYAVQIKDGILHTSFGEDGKPGAVTFDGKIEPDGTANIAVNGLIKPGDDPLRRPPGTPYHYVLTLELKESSGAGVRTQTPRSCRAELSKLSATPSPPSDVDEGSKRKSDAKPNGATAVAVPDQRDSGARQVQPAGSGLSCSVMRGRCAVVCVANTGRPNCASTVCVRLEQECMSTGCWHGRGFSGCGLAKR